MSRNGYERRKGHIARWHISPHDGKPRRCVAQNRGCRYGIPNEEHFYSPESAAMGAEAAHMQEALSSTNGKFRGNGNLTHAQALAIAERLKKNTTNPGQVVESARTKIREVFSKKADASQLNQEEARDAVSFKRMSKITEAFAARDQNFNADRMANAFLAKTTDSYVVNPNGTRGHLRDAVKLKNKLNAMEGNRDRFQETMNKIANDPSIAEGKYKAGNITVTVADNQLDSKVEKELSDEERDKISDVAMRPNMEEAVKNLPPEVLAKVTARRSIATLVDGRENDEKSQHYHGLERYESLSHAGADFPDKKTEFQAELNHYAEVSKRVQNDSSLGGMNRSEVKKRIDGITGQLKERAATDPAYAQRDDVVFGGNTHDSGLLVHKESVLVSDKELRAVLTKEQYNSILKPKKTINKELAEQHLPKDKFNALYGARSISVREGNAVPKVKAPTKK